MKEDSVKPSINHEITPLERVLDELRLNNSRAEKLLEELVNLKVKLVGSEPMPIVPDTAPLRDGGIVNSLLDAVAIQRGNIGVLQDLIEDFQGIL